VSRVMPIMFGRHFLTEPSRAVERDLWRQRLARNGRHIVRAVRGVIERTGVADEITRVRIPTLVLVGDQDVATPRPKAERIVSLIPGATLTIIPNAGHSSSVEQPEFVTAAIAAFIAALP
jgi:3-oxoadipate enol-lactonase